MELAPIILFVYNRPVHTQRTIDALKKNDLASESILYIFSDGPKDDANDESIMQIESVRKYIHTIEGFKNVVIIEQPHNVGLDTSIMNGVTEVINRHGRCITLEDDIETHPWFLRYMNECLGKYELDRRIQMIGGYNERISVPWWYSCDVYLAHRCASTGWAMWADRWNGIDWELTGYDEFIKDDKQKERFCRGGHDMLPMLKEQMSHKVPAWDIRLDYTICKNDTYVVRPIHTLTIHHGYDGSGIHYAVMDPYEVASPFPKGLEYNLRLPQFIKTSKTLERRFQGYYDHTLKRSLTIHDIRVKLALRTRLKRIFNLHS